MNSIIEHYRDRGFYMLLMAEAETKTFPEPVISMPTRVSQKERSLSSSMQQLRSALSEVSRILSEQPELAREWRGELLECGRHVNFAIQQATSRMRMLGVPEHQGRAP